MLGVTPALNSLQVRSSRSDEILAVPRNDTAIVTHPRKAGHPLADLQHLPESESWRDKVHKDMLVAEDPYVEEQPGTHKSPVAPDRNAVIF
jgi:hypothetical protein